MTDTFQTFAALHTPGTPLILFNAWDAGSAAAVVKAGGKAIATGSWSVAAAHGHTDGEDLPIDLTFATAREIVAAVDVPVSIDFEGGYATDLDDLAGNFGILASTGAIGCNFEDGVPGGSEIRGATEQSERIAVARRAVGDAFFINARTDLFLKKKDHNDALADAAIARGRAYAEAGASGFFVPGLMTLPLIARIVEAVPLPVNIMTFPGVPSTTELATAGVARISHGPGPYRQAMAALEEAARAALAG